MIILKDALIFQSEMAAETCLLWVKHLPMKSQIQCES
jgi:hypothetical protein